MAHPSGLQKIANVVELKYWQQTEFYERLEQRVAKQLQLANGREDLKDPKSKRLPKEFSVDCHLTDTNLI